MQSLRQKNQALQQLAIHLTSFATIVGMIALASGIVSLVTAKTWYEQPNPYRPFLQISTLGIATPEKQIPWGRIHSIQKRSSGTKTLLDVIYAKPDNVRGTLTITIQDLPCSEKHFFEILAKHEKRNTTTNPPVFSTAPLNEKELKQIKEKGFYSDENCTLLCRTRSHWATFAGIFLAAGSICAASLYKWTKIKIPQVDINPETIIA